MGSGLRQVKCVRTRQESYRIVAVTTCCGSGRCWRHGLRTEGFPVEGTRLSKTSCDKHYHAAQMAIAGTNPDRAKATHGEYQTTRHQHSQVVVAKPLHNPEDLQPQTGSRSRIVRPLRRIGSHARRVRTTDPARGGELGDVAICGPEHDATSWGLVKMSWADCGSDKKLNDHYADCLLHKVYSNLEASPVLLSPALYVSDSTSHMRFVTGD